MRRLTGWAHPGYHSTDRTHVVTHYSVAERSSSWSLADLQQGRELPTVRRGEAS